ncbi:MAG: hypothetical protein ACRD5K_15855, partial [Candidatus Acidiferrales bacterium]
AGLGALGAYFSASLFNGVGGLMRHSREAVLCGAILSLIFLYLWRVSHGAPTPNARLARQPNL